MTSITEEEFASWRIDPVTQWVIGELAKAAEAQREAWAATSWEGGVCDPMLLKELKTRADAYSALSEITHADLVEKLAQ